MDGRYALLRSPKRGNVHRPSNGRGGRPPHRSTGKEDEWLACPGTSREAAASGPLAGVMHLAAAALYAYLAGAPHIRNDLGSQDGLNG